MRTLVPYRTLAGDVGLEIVRVSLDDHALPYSMISRGDQMVALHEAERSVWSEAMLHVRATLPEREIAEGPWANVSCVAVLTERATNARTVRPLSKEADGLWTGSVAMARDLHRARATLSVNVVATVDEVAGRVVGSAELPWTVDLTARTPERKRAVNIVELDFRDGPEEWLRPFKESPWLLETTAEVPTVYLNTAFEGLNDILKATRNDVEKGVRGLVAAQIADEVWTAMFHASVCDLEFDDDGTPQIPSDWRESVLHTMLPDIVPNASMADALLEIHSRRVSGNGWAELQTNIQYAASRRARVPKNLRTAVRALSSSGGVG
ncbi:hypothetical protein [Streptomyces sp. 8N706]|uniref:hypothetical protein n=1 Tax=Streptomyces sp. 8N706 TaxID=3457416 RepID=UPI003FD6B3C1